MMLVIGIVGFILLAFGITMMFIHTQIRGEDVVEEGRFGDKRIPAHPRILSMWKSRRARTVITSIGFLLLAIPQMFMYARPGHQYYLVSPFGVKSAVFNSGYHAIMPLHGSKNGKSSWILRL